MKNWSKSNNMPFDCFWVDAGWNGPAHLPDMVSNCGDMWERFAGDWRFNPAVHPDGNLAKVADAAHASGMKMLLWCAPEWCATGDPKPPLFLEHREWLLPVDGPKLRDRNRLSVNLGDPAACDWVIETVSRLIRENKLDIYRQDFNIRPLPIWQENDATDRQGVTESKYVAGFYRFWDAIRARFPDVLIENCSGGARRMDFRTVSYSHSYCRTDYARPRLRRHVARHRPGHHLRCPDIRRRHGHDLWRALGGVPCRDAAAARFPPDLLHANRFASPMTWMDSLETDVECRG